MPVKKPELLELKYEGSVKRVWQPVDRPGRLWFEYTDDYSVFDWGKMPDTIANKGRSLAILGAFFFEHLSHLETWQALPESPHLKKFNRDWLEKRWQHMVFKRELMIAGARSHFQGLVSPDGSRLSLDEAGSSAEPIYAEVLGARVDRPKAAKVLGQTIFFYPRRDQRFGPDLIPLEVVFRFGMPAGSSLKSRLDKDPDYARALGLSRPPQANELFEHPVIEFYTKLEPKDRLLTLQEAGLLADVGADHFENLTELSFDLALALYVLFADRGIELWDGKFEFVIGSERLQLADSVGPDELRLIYKGCQLSKELIRQVYRGGRWESAILEAQELARQRQVLDWKQICQERLKAEPPPLPANFKALADKLYGSLTNHVVGRAVIQDQQTLDGLAQAIPTVIAPGV